jgi:nucleotide-binding universal stress UspA family protein
MSTTILFATDFSPSSDAASQITRTLARHIDARVVCVHAAAMVETPPEGLANSDIEGFYVFYQEELEARRLRIQRLAAELGQDGIHAVAELRQGAAADAICDAARDSNAALVVVGSHGRTGLGRLVLGSVAERVVRLCETSVLVARPPVAGQQGFQRVLVATDFGEAAEVALDQAATLTAPDATIDILHCWQLDEFPDGLLAQPDTHAPHQMASRRAADRARDLGEALVRRVAASGRTAKLHLQEGRATSGIHAFLEHQTTLYDLVAVGTHGRTGLQRLLIGSVAESTVRHAPCSVLVARPRT